MFAKKVHQPSALDKAIDDATRWLDPNSQDYEKSISALERLYQLKDKESKTRISPDTKAMVFANLFGIFLILQHERANVITTRAFNLVKTLR